MVGKRLGSGFKRLTVLGLTWLTAISIVSVAAPGRAEAALGNVEFVSVAPADGSALKELSRIEAVVQDPDNDTIMSVSYRIKRLSDNKYLWSGEDPESSWLELELMGVGMTNGGGGSYYADLPQPTQDALYRDGVYEIRYYATDISGSYFGNSYKTITFTLDRTPPRIGSATISRDSLMFEFTEPLAKPAGESLKAGDFDFRVNDVPVVPAIVAEVQGSNSVLAILSDPVTKADRVTVAYVGSPAYTDAAGNPASHDPVEAGNLTPGAFQQAPVLNLTMKAKYALKAGDAIASFVPSSSGGTSLSFVFPSALDNPPTLNTGAIAKTDFVVRDLSNGTSTTPRAVHINDTIFRAYLSMPDGFSFTQGVSYELAMSDSAGGNEIRLPPSAAANASASLYLFGQYGDGDIQDEYEFENLTIDEPDPVDFAVLDAAIADARELHDAATEGAANGQYLAGAKAELMAAIEAAEFVRDDAGSTQGDVDAAVAALGEAVSEFESKKATVDLTELNEAITDARELHDAATEGTANGQYLAGAKAELMAAIEAAELVRDDAGSTQEDVDAAVAALGEAVSEFETKKTTVDLAELNEAIADARELHDAAKEGAANGQYLAGAKAELLAAIEAAELVRDDAGSTQGDVDAAVAALDEAVSEFETKKATVDLTELNEAIADARELHDAAKEGAANGQYLSGAKAEFMAAIEAAELVRDDAGSTQGDVDAAVAGLDEAVSEFETKKAIVDLTELTAAIVSAQAKHDSAIEGTGNGSYKAGSKAVLQTAIDTAAAVKNNALSTQDQVDDANAMLSEAIAAFEAQKIVLASTGGGGGGTGSGTTTYTLDVAFGEGHSGKLTVKRTTESDSRVQDTLELADAFIEQAIVKLKAVGQNRLTIELPASLQGVTRELAFIMPSSAANRLAAEGIALEIRTSEAGLLVPSSSLKGAKETLKFKISPLNNKDERSSVESRAKIWKELRTIAGSGQLSLIGQPVSIETNFQQRKATVTFPLAGAGDDDMGIYIEHSDGSKELLRGRAEASGNGERMLAFDVSRFSTFAIVRVDGWSKYESSQGTGFLDVPYMNGYVGGLFKPEGSLTRAETAAILARIATGGIDARDAAFPDIPDAYWAREAIGKAVALGAMAGLPDGGFHPNKPITRAEMATILSRLLPNNAGSGTAEASDFADTSGHWAQSAIRKARVSGLLNGYADGTFRPEQTISRAEAAVVLNRLIGRQAEPSAKPFFSDVPTTHWAFGAIQAATGK